MTGSVGAPDKPAGTPPATASTASTASAAAQVVTPMPPPTAGPMIHADNLGRRFGDFWAIRHLSFDLQPGEVFGLLGPNGAGKTTTVRLLTALISPSEGSAALEGFDVVTAPEDVRRRIGLLTETPGLYERLTARQNLEFFGRLQMVPTEVREQRIEQLLRLFDLWDRRDEQTGTFSKGMKQKLAIARALLHEPRVLFFDEPTSGLDPEAAYIVREAIADLRSAGRTIVLCTHNLDEAERLCDRVAFVRGEILRVDSPARLRAAAGTSRVHITLAAPPPADLVAALRVLPGIRAMAASGDELDVQADDASGVTPSIVRLLGGRSDVDVLGVTATSASMETVYFEVLGVRPPTNGAAR